MSSQIFFKKKIRISDNVDDSLLGMQRAREIRARSFPVIKMFNEVSNLLGTSGEAKRTTRNTEPEPLGIRSFSSLLLMSSSELLTSLNTFATEKDQARDSRRMPSSNRYPING